VQEYTASQTNSMATKLGRTNKQNQTTQKNTQLNKLDKPKQLTQ